jgi:eukaryotic-like serine/threonine-protein kinase
MIGQSLLHYRIVEKIGEGGMGVVYKAVDTHLDRPVAIKILPPDKVADSERKRRFVLEAKSASALHHPNIVVIHDIASDRGFDFIVMEYVDGQSLDQLVGRRGMKLGPALGYAVQIADGLARAHAAGIIHRDLKPTNVMVTAGGLIKILDFGLAKLSDQASSAAAAETMTLAQTEKPRTEEGYVVGTAAYMSPEQAEGGVVDSRSDIFSFGVLLYEMLTGQKAFQRDSRMKTFAAVLNEEPRAASDINEAVPPEAERLLARCLRKDPQRRWQTVSDLKVALQDLKEDSESGKLPAAERPARARKRPAALVIAGAVFLFAVAAFLLRPLFFKPAGEVKFETIRLTFDSGLTTTPAFSPDGKMVAYASDREGHGTLDLWIQQVSGGKPLRLTDHPANDWFPDFSPDGTKIVFRSERDGGGIYVIDTLGGEARRIADQGTQPRFSPDGSLVSYVVIPASLEQRFFKIFLVPAKGGTPRAIQPKFRFFNINQGAGPVWSPDGKAILFSGASESDPTSSDWWVVPVEGGEPVRTHAVANLALSPYVHFPYAWKGNDVYFISGTTVEGVNIFRVSIDPKSRRISGPAVPITSGPGMKMMISVLANGSLVYAHTTVIMDAWSLDARPDEGVVAGEFRKITQDLMQKFYPSVSRDGKKIAFAAFGGLQNTRIEVRLKSLPDGHETVIPSQGQSTSFALFPRLNADGTMLAFRDFVAGKWHTFILPAGSTTPTDAGETGRVLDFFSHPDWVLIQSKPNALAKRNIKTGETTPVLELPSGSLNDGHLSADNRWLVFRMGLADGRAAISIAPLGLVPASPRDIVPVVESDHYLSNPRWSPNGRYVYYLSEQSGRCGLYAQKLDPQTKKPLGEAQAVFFTQGERINLNFPRGLGFIDVAADKIILAVDEITSNIFLVKPVAR